MLERNPDLYSAAMAVRVMFVRPTVPVSAIVSHLPRSTSSSAAGCRIHATPQSNRLPCYCSSAGESSSAFTTHGIGIRAARGLNLGYNFSGGCVNWETSNGFAKSPTRAILSAMSGGPSEAQTLSVEDEELIRAEEKIVNHQRAAAHLNHNVEARTIVDRLGHGILSTVSKRWDGVPVPSMVQYAAEEGGTILLSVSSLSPHTADLEANPKCALLVAKDLNDKSDFIITIIGEAYDVPEQGIEEAKSTYLKKHPGAFWVDFGDFKMVRVEPKHVRCVSGLITGTASVSQSSGEEFKAAAVDPISQFSDPIAHHMNADHADQTKMIVEHSVGITVDSAVIIDVDSLGFYVMSQRQGKPLKLRIPFPRKAESRKDVKTLIVEMLAASAPEAK